MQDQAWRNTIVCVIYEASWSVKALISSCVDYHFRSKNFFKRKKFNSVIGFSLFYLKLPMMRRLQVSELLIAGILNMFLVSQHVGSAQKVFGYALKHSNF